ncbi:MAG: hypothetical protein SP4CHLAM5_01830 [Chlamydiia bacterium]|nr:hypothetical protein [Chlamydiia bacterium]MCH9618057.1 hypothetical protein [Chlamydiia bacterium]MCH9624687.1 hypothetical protein [Chlamydiia bacterium]
MNTWGIHSVNNATFNQSSTDHGLTYPRDERNIVVTALRINNAVLDILGYIPAYSFFSGCTRMAIGSAITIYTLAKGSPTARSGIIIQRWYYEALKTGLAQIARGYIEAFVPYRKLFSINYGFNGNNTERSFGIDGRKINMLIGIMATLPNILGACEESTVCYGCRNNGDDEFGSEHGPHEKPSYPWVISPLYLA